MTPAPTTPSGKAASTSAIRAAAQTATIENPASTSTAPASTALASTAAASPSAASPSSSRAVPPSPSAQLLITAPVTPQAKHPQAGNLPEQHRPEQRLIVLCDGTWQSRRKVSTVLRDGSLTVEDDDADYFTNVAILAQAIKPAASVPNKHGLYPRQIVFYQSGLGTVRSLASYLFEGATGAGIEDKIADAYRFLVDNYQPGDSINAFGFSRGAYTARNLVGYINYAGLMKKSDAALAMMPCWKAYQLRDPSKPETIIHSAEMMHRATGLWPGLNAEETEVTCMRAVADINKTPLPANIEAWIRRKDARTKEGRIQLPNVKVCGVWDTVGAKGIPGHFMSPELTRYYGDFDPMLAPSVKFAFNAMALFEDRKDFIVTRWYTPDPNKESEADRILRQDQVLRQCWFQGSHSDCGGSKSFHGLSDVTLAWMVANLTDREIPLIDVDLKIIREMQDRRHRWGKQPQHPSRIALELQETRQVMKVPKIRSLESGSTAWSSMVNDRRNNHETLHHSVIVGGQYNSTSRQFAELRAHDPDALEQLFRNATEASLLPTERQLRWYKTQMSSPITPKQIWDVAADAVPGGAPADEVDDDIDTGLAPQRPRYVPEAVWAALSFSAKAPVYATSFLINRGLVPQDNLKPGVLVSALEKAGKLVTGGYAAVPGSRALTQRA